jgi:hypothetical protein
MDVQKDLEKVLETTAIREDLIKANSVKEELIHCYYCNKIIKPGKEYISPCNLTYCNVSCFMMFVED